MGIFNELSVIFFEGVTLENAKKRLKETGRRLLTELDGQKNRFIVVKPSNKI